MGYVVVLHSTPAKIQLRRLRGALGISRAHALGLMVELWILADQDGQVVERSDDGTDAVLSWTAQELDGELGLDGASAAMIRVGWLQELDDGRLVVPRFDRYNGRGGKSAVRHRQRNAEASAKRRSAAQKRPSAAPTNQPTDRGAPTGAPPVGRAGGAPPTAPPAVRRGAPRDYEPGERVLSFAEARAAGVVPEQLPGLETSPASKSATSS